MEHTKGDWKNNGGIIETTPIGRPYSELQKICVVGVPNNQTKEDTANAHLIAAAPDLLKACKVAVLALTHEPINSDDIKFIKEAIAKAEN